MFPRPGIEAVTPHPVLHVGRACAHGGGVKAESPVALRGLVGKWRQAASFSKCCWAIR
jgi:hypothetical protein